MRTLNEIYEKYSSPEGHGDKGTAHTYIDEYSRILEPYRNNITFLEIGLFFGESIQMWSEYFNNSKIYGVDITSKHLKDLLNHKDFEIIIGDATNQDILSSFPQDIMFDVVIDDGSHKLSDQIKTFNILKDKIKRGGLYIVEDVLSIDNTKDQFMELHGNCEIIDNRDKKNRHDDVLVIYRF